MAQFPIIIGLCTIAFFAGIDAVKINCQPGVFGLIRKDSCLGYFMCAFGAAIEMPDCPPGLVFSSYANVCVLPGSTYDDCNRTSQPARGDIMKITTVKPDPKGEKCENEGDVIESHEFCQAYFRCMKLPTGDELSQTRLECPYPQLFSTKSLKCEYFEDVDCGTRTEITDPCDYTVNQCEHSECIPCIDRLASCNGRQDGFNPHSVKIWTPMYVYCYKERAVSQWTCPEKMIFHADKRVCVDIDQIPTEYGGVSMNCTGRDDGFYGDVLGRCDRYHVCRHGRLIYNVQCEEGEEFSPLKKSCIKSEKCE